MFKTGMFVRSNVIWFDIGKDTDIKSESCGSMKHQSLGGYFHHHMGKACIYGIAHMTAQLQGFRRGER